MANLKDVLDLEKLETLISEGYISKRSHPSLPLFILNYSNKCTFEHKWDHEIRMCRGLIVDRFYNIVARGFYKFFNIGQQEGISLSEANAYLAQGWDYELSEKMDGWYGTGYCWSGQWAVSSRGSFTSEGAVFATEKFQKIVKANRDHVFPIGFNPIFEIIFKRGQIVIPYDFEGIVLLAVKNTETGYELPYKMVKKIWTKMNEGLDKPLCRLVPEIVGKNIEDAMSEDIQRKEGYIITLSHPTNISQEPIKAKIKFDDYCRLHRILTGITGNQLHRALAKPLSEYLEGDTPPEFRAWVKKQADEYYNKFQSTLIETYHQHIEFNAIYSFYVSIHAPLAQINESDNSKATSLGRTDAIKWLKNKYPDSLTFVLLMHDGKIRELHEAIWKSFKPVGLVKPYYEEGTGE